VLINLRNEPLLFVQGPPVFIKVVTKHEESTSVFMLSGEESEVTNEAEQEQIPKQMTAVKVADPSLVRRIMYLGTPFSRQVYRPLQFVLDGETITGTIEKIEGETVLIGVGEDASNLVSIEMARIEDILWRGDPFADN
jgi:hypothetical protein